jgi:DNA-binding PadR family transcriptional regulator
MTGTAPNLHDAEGLLPLSPAVYHVLLALGDDVLHGYAMMQSFEELTGGAEQLLPGTLYATLARMVETGLLEEAAPPDPGADARRRYYRVTDFGRAVKGAETARMARLVDVASGRRLAEQGG